MTVQMMTISLPNLLYERLRRRAEHAGRSIEAEAAEMLATSVAESEALAPELEKELASLALLDDEELWRAARSHLAAEDAQELEALHLKRQSVGLTDAEAHTAAVLVVAYERAMLVRAQAAVLLQQRGHHVEAPVGQE